MTEQVNQISLPKLAEEIDEHVARIRGRAPSTTQASGPMLELSGTVLPMLRDLVSYVSVLEEAVIRSSEETSVRIDQLEDGIVAAVNQGGGTQFEPEDAEKFIEFFTATKLVMQTLRDQGNNPEPVKNQFEQMIKLADELIALVEESTLEDGDEDDGGEGVSDTGGGAA